MLRDVPDEFPVPVTLEDLGEELASGPERSNREVKGTFGEVEGLGDVHRVMSAQSRGHVAHDHIRGAPESLEELRLDRGLLEVPSDRFDSFQPPHGRLIHGENSAGRPDPLASDLRPPARGCPEVHDDVPVPEESVPAIDLGKLDRRPAAIGLSLRGPVEPVVAASLDPGLSHRRKRRGPFHKGFPGRRLNMLTGDGTFAYPMGSYNIAVALEDVMTLEGYEGERVLLSYDVSGSDRAVATRVCQMIFGRRRTSQGPDRDPYQQKGFIHRPGVVWIGQSVLVLPPRDAADLQGRLERLGVRVATGPVSIARVTLDAFRRGTRSPT